MGDNPKYQAILQDMISRLMEICNPNEIDMQALNGQKKLLDQYGGRDAVLKSIDKYYFSYSPVPEEVL